VIAALILSAALASQDQEGALTRDSMVSDAKDRLLHGEPLPSDLDERLMRLNPSDRIEVLIFLRRSGLLSGPAWPADRLLAPSIAGGGRE